MQSAPVLTRKHGKYPVLWSKNYSNLFGHEWVKVLDSVITQLHDRFPERSLNFVQQMTHFSHEKLLNTGDDTLNPDIVSDLCGYYGLDTKKLCEEFDVFSQLYKGSYQNIDLSDVLSSKDDKYKKCKTNQ
ncbi:hypothetical protein J6590_046635 [Homalodisca vitripennis]|nr:hypothetical protein J6590_046635 [Homalodisca vitripennis]